MNVHLAQQAEESRPGWWKWGVWLEGTTEDLARVREVVYTLHPTYPQPVHVVADKDSKFRLESAGWGEFMIFATVRTLDGQDLSLRHWLTFGSTDASADTSADTPTIFVSSAAADEWFADALQDALEAKHARILRPSDNVLAGVPMAAWLGRERVAAAVMVLSDAKSPWIDQELDAIGDQNLPVIPVLIGSVETTVPAQLRGHQRLHAPDPDAEVQGIAGQIIRIVQSGAATSRPLISSGGTGLVNYAELYQLLSNRLPSLLLRTAGAEVEAALRTLQESQHPDVMTAFENPATAAVQSWVAQFAPSTGRVTRKFATTDFLGWMGSFLKWSSQKAPWLSADARPDPIPDAHRTALFGNWGTGLYGAPVCSTTIARDPGGFALVMHLGDTFYSGTEDEIRSRLLTPWPPVPRAINRALNGNHEMYSGGHAYFGIALPRFDQRASYFAFQNDHWLLAALDTSYVDGDVYGEQVEWLTRLVSQGAGRRVVLFSHHQPYSLRDQQHPKLVERLSALLGAQRIFAWYWAHEFGCVLYERHPAWGVWGRCIGHGGYPYARDRKLGALSAERRWIRLPPKDGVPAADLLDGPNPYVLGHEQEYGPHGFAVLEFDGPRLVERIVDAGGDVLRTTDLTAG